MSRSKEHVVLHHTGVQVKYSSADKNISVQFSLKSFSPAESDLERMYWAASHRRIAQESTRIGGVDLAWIVNVQLSKPYYSSKISDNTMIHNDNKSMRELSISFTQDLQ